jgi:hypothetical protein
MIKLEVSKSEILGIIDKAKANIKISSYENVRDRHINVQFDCLLRGYIGEFAMGKFFASNGVIVDSVNYMSSDSGMDVDFVINSFHVELKTSLVPDMDVDVSNVVSRRDIKLLKRSSVIEGLKGDVHIQLYINQRRKAKDNFLVGLDVNLMGDSLYLYKKLLCRGYLDSVYFVGWIDKPTLVERLNKLPPDEREWSFSGAIRSFWKCRIKDSKPPLELIEFLKEI